MWRSLHADNVHAGLAQLGEHLDALGLGADGADDGALPHNAAPTSRLSSGARAQLWQPVSVRVPAPCGKPGGQSRCPERSCGPAASPALGSSAGSVAWTWSECDSRRANGTNFASGARPRPGGANRSSCRLGRDRSFPRRQKLHPSYQGTIRKHLTHKFGVAQGRARELLGAASRSLRTDVQR